MAQFLMNRLPKRELCLTWARYLQGQRTARGALFSSVPKEKASPTSSTEGSSSSASSSSNKEEEPGYGKSQKDPHKVAEDAHAQWADEPKSREESLHDTGFDMSKRSGPSGDE